MKIRNSSLHIIVSSSILLASANVMASPIPLTDEQKFDILGDLTNTLHFFADNQDENVFWYAPKYGQLKTSGENVDFKFNATVGHYGLYAGQPVVSYSGAFNTQLDPQTEFALNNLSMSKGWDIKPLAANRAHTTASPTGLSRDNEGNIKTKCNMETYTSNRGTDIQLPVCKVETLSGEWVNAEISSESNSGFVSGYTVASEQVYVNGVTTSGWVEKVDSKLTNETNWHDLFTFVTEWEVQSGSMEKVGFSKVDWRRLINYVFEFKKNEVHLYSESDVKDIILSLLSLEEDKTGVFVKYETGVSLEKVEQALTEKLKTNSIYTTRPPSRDRDFLYS